MSDGKRDRARVTPWLWAGVGVFACLVGIARLMLQPQGRELPLSFVLIGLGFAGLWSALRAHVPWPQRRYLGLALLVGLALSALAGSYGPFSRLPPRVRPSAIRAVRAGMTEAEVRAILGPPVETRPWGDQGQLLYYARPHLLAPWSPRLWISLRDGRTVQVQGHVYPMIPEKRLVYPMGESVEHETVRHETDEFEPTFRPWWEISR
jgi:hypothetical protein